MTADSVLVRYEAADAVATLTLDSPHNRNALSTALVRQLVAGLDAAASDDSVRTIVLTHTGSTFCAGADLSEASASTPTASSAQDPATTDPDGIALERARQLTALLRAIVAHPKPVVCALDGHVRAGGLGIVAACDLAVAGPASTFALTEARLGVAASIISLTVLPRLTSRAAGRYFLTGEKFGADEAAALGLVTLAAPDVDAVVAELTAALRQGSPQGLTESKKLVTAPILAGFDERGEELAALSARLFTSEEASEGFLSFLERRAPRWAV